MGRQYCIASFIVFCFLSACSTLNYTRHSFLGQLEISNRSLPISVALTKNSIKESDKVILRRVSLMKAFAGENGLQIKNNFTHYVPLTRPVASYVVVASEAYRLQTKVWSFPIVGSFPYLGFFKLELALKEKKKLQDEGYDVWIRGAPTFSTLGWFPEPIYSSMLNGDSSEAELAEQIFHEATHSTVYRKDQGPFNERLANFVGRKLRNSYIKKYYGEEQLEQLLRADKNNEETSKLIGSYALKAKNFYESESFMKAQDKEKLKQKFLSEIQSEIEKTIKRPLPWKINNAVLVSFRTYESDSSFFEELYQRCKQNMGQFLLTIERNAPYSFSGGKQLDHFEDFIRPLLSD